jgi:hypothetical protein
MILEDVVSAFRDRFHLPDPGIVEVVLAAWVANLWPDDSIWLLVVGPPASGKTEVVSSLRELPQAHLASDLSLAGLLTLGGRENDTGDPLTAGRGLLRELGCSGVILAPELSTLIAEGRREESKLFGALREIATDSRYSRQIGGKLLRWEGRAGFIGCVTEAVDELSMGALGERFLLYRMPVMDEEDDLRAGSRALADDRSSPRELRQVVNEFVEDLHVPEKTPALDDEDRDRLTLLAIFVARCRSTVIWDTRHSDAVVDVPQPERSPRLLRGCAQLLSALRLIGCDEGEAWRVVDQVGLGSIRTRKRRVLAALLKATRPMPTSVVAGRARLPETGVRRDLFEMDAFGIVELVGERPTCWSISDKYQSMWSHLVQLGGAMDLATLRHATELGSSPLSLVEGGFPGTENVGDFAAGREEAW